jgi:hypothetical protein
MAISKKTLDQKKSNCLCQPITRLNLKFKKKCKY